MLQEAGLPHGTRASPVHGDRCRRPCPGLQEIRLQFRSSVALFHLPGRPHTMIRPILRYGADALDATAKPVDDFGPDLQKVIDDMI